MKILVSACLLGEPIRYDGRDNENKVSAHQAALEQWKRNGWIVPVCPETLGGLPTPRPAAEITGGSGSDVLNAQARVLTQTGRDVSAEFIAGAQRTLTVALQHNAIAALLAARSPSCGNTEIYNGAFKGELQAGMGVTAALLEQHGIRCFNPEQFVELQAWVEHQV